MPAGPGSPLRPRAAHTIEAARYIAAGLAVGFEHELVWDGIPTRDRARLMKQGLFNAAKGNKPTSVSVSAEIEPGSNGDWRIRFTLHDKAVARAFVVGKYGKDRTQWPYRAR